MSESRFSDVQTLGLDAQKVELLLARVRREVDEGLLPAAQVALARHGKVAVFELNTEKTRRFLVALFRSPRVPRFGAGSQ